MILLRLRTALGYQLARYLMRYPALVKQPKMWAWMERQFSRKAALGSAKAQAFYGHILLFRGVGLGAQQEGRRLLVLAAQAGDAKSAYQLGVLSLQAGVERACDAQEAARWWSMAAQAGHPLAAKRLAKLYEEGAPGLAANAEQARFYHERARELGL